MKLKFILLYSVLSLLGYNLSLPAQEALNYQKPPQEILELVDIERAPSVRMDSDRKNMVLLYRDTYKTIADLSQEELRLGGLRIDPKTNIGSRVTYSNNIRVQSLDQVNNKIKDVIGLP